MSTLAEPTSRSARRLFSSLGLAFGSMLACNAVLGIGEADLICAEGGCEDAGVFTGDDRPINDPEAVPGRGASGRGAPGDGGTQDGSFTPASTSAASPDVSESPAGSNATPPGGGGEVDGDNSGSGSDNGGSSGPGSGNTGAAGNGSTGGAGSGSGDDDDDDDDDDDQPPPPPPPSPCQGRASGEAFCSGATRISCGPGGSVAQSTSCLSAAHCQQATGTACATCLATEVRCDIELLVSCNATRTGFDTRRCPSAALCDAATNTCGVAACSAGQSRCRGAQLERCNATQTGFDPVTDCGSPQACNEAAGTCNVCAPGAVRCQNASTLAICDAFGQSEALVGCGLLESCVGGECRPLGLPL